MRDHFIAALADLAEHNPRIMLITGDLGFGVLDSFVARFPHQYLNAGVAEQNMTGLATGLALEGRIVFTYSIANFPTLRCLEQLRNGACYHEANVKVVAIGGGFSYGPLGASHHATEDLAILRALAEMTVLSPCDVWEATEGTKALASHPGPGYLRLDKSAAPVTYTEGERFTIGKARLLREGQDITLAVTGGIMGEALIASDLLAQQGIFCRVLSIHTVQPLDSDAITDAARQTGGIVTIEEHTIRGGLGGAVAETLLDTGVLPRRFKRIGLRSGLSSVVGSQQYLRKLYGLDAASLVRSILECLESDEVEVSEMAPRRSAGSHV